MCKWDVKIYDYVKIVARSLISTWAIYTHRVFCSLTFELFMRGPFQT